MAVPSEKMAALLKPRPAATAKDAAARLVEAAGGMTAAARVDGVRVSKTMLFKYTDADDPDHRDSHMPIDVVAALERATGEAHVAAYLAAATGHVLLKVRFDPADPALDVGMAKVGEGAARLFAEYAEALAAGDDTPGRIDPAEAARMIRATDDLLAVLCHARGRLIEKVEKDR